MGVHLRGDSNSRIHGTCTCILNLKFKYMFSVLTESAQILFTVRIHVHVVERMRHRTQKKGNYEHRRRGE